MCIKKLLLILSIFVLIHPAYALTLEGGVKKIETAEQARQEVFLKPIWVIDPHPYKMYASKAPDGYRLDYSDGTYSIATGSKMLTYSPNNKLIYIAISDKNVMNFPRKLSRYEYPSGKLVELTYGTSPKDGFIFKPDGSLAGIWEDGVLHEGDKLINTAKTTYFN